jgi:5-(carboxyamino)imidazole ribonucleotide mutase
VATVSIGGARNAGILAARILATSDPQLFAQLEADRASLADAARAKGRSLHGRLG